MSPVATRALAAPISSESLCLSPLNAVPGRVPSLAKSNPVIFRRISHLKPPPVKGGAKDDDRARAILLSVSGAPLLDDRTPWQVFVQVGEEFLCRSRAIGELQLLHVAQLDETGQSARGQQWTAWKRARVRIRISIFNWDTICSSGWDCKRGTVHIPASERT